MPLLYTPADKFKVVKIDIIAYQDINIAYWPYSSVVIILVKIGVVTNKIPFCNMLHIVNQIDALVGSVKPPSFSLILSNKLNPPVIA